MKEGRHRPYLTVNPRSAAYDMLVKEGFLGLTTTPADPDAVTPADGEPRPQLLGLVEGTVPRSVHLHGLGRFHMGLYTPKPDLCGHCCQFGDQSWKCKSASCCRYCSGSHPSSRYLDKIHAGTRVILQ
ncbi:hypothetical protein E2C01_066988 [Portunus trituberculatus]|uniref:Uncharacterized protein n=1 Tax=Portunus trituberculatus TaxID=210409 RepID=A0A5B7HS89_PORTR|nr:hypothetical protein [Portunus trituberculatus]